MSQRQRWANRFHRYLANPVMRRVAGWLPGQALLETRGRRTGHMRRTPVGGRRDGDVFWMVSNHGRQAGYVKNILADPRVRVQLRGRWYVGHAHLVEDDDAADRLRSLPRFNSRMVRWLGTDLTTIRVDLGEDR